MTWTPCLPLWTFSEKSRNELREHRGKHFFFFFPGEKELNKNKSGRGGGAEEHRPLGCVSRAWCRPAERSVVWLSQCNLDGAASEGRTRSRCEAGLPCISSRTQTFLWESSEQLLCSFKQQQQPPSPTLLRSLPPCLPPSLSRPLSFFSLLPQTLTSHCLQQ